MSRERIMLRRSNELRVAVVGSGPSGFYAAGQLLSAEDFAITVDMFDRLPTPFGLVRAGVAPDHPKIKSVTRVFDKTAAHPGFRFFGNVEVGRDITTRELSEWYDAVVYAHGTNRGKRADFPGETLPGNHVATEFVGWYNGHPDHRRARFDLSGGHAVIIGNGNVALDAARMLALSVDELETTDIADHALDRLRRSRIEEVVVLGRRGPQDAAFTQPELLELGELHGVDVIVDPDDLPQTIDHDASMAVRNKLLVLGEYATRPPVPGNKRIVLKFHTRPIAAAGETRVTSLRVQRHGVCDELPVGLIIHAVGYTGSPLAGLPFDADRGVIVNDAGRLVVNEDPIRGLYVAGWIKRGPSGVIGTNKACAQETVDSLLADAREGKLARTRALAPEPLQQKLIERAAKFTDFAGWAAIDSHERGVGQIRGRPRIKVTHVPEMVSIARRGGAR